MIDENLKKAIRNNKLVLFIGAGASLPLNYPSWQNLVAGILDDLNSNFSDTSDLSFTNLKRSILNGSRSPLEILNKIEQDSKSGDQYRTKAKEYVYEVFNSLNNEDSLDSSVHKLLWELSSRIVTTNYDRILEYNKPEDPRIDIFGNENIFMTLKAQKDNAKFLYKIHGDFKNPETIVLFESDYKSIYSKNNSNEDALSTFFKNYTLLFLGFSLSDPFVNELFTKIKKLYNNHTIANHFIFSTSDTGDFSEYDVKKILIDNWNDSLVSYLNALIQEKTASIIDDVSANILDTKDNSIEDLTLLIKNKIDELKNDPGNKSLASEMHDIKTKIDQLIYGDLDYLKTFDKEYKNTHLQMLFDTIYATEKLSKETFDEINRIRHDYENHKWFERCQLVSALTCSLFIFNKADEKKISLLVDFINDNEDRVWKRALTYLVMILNHLGNKWLRFDPIKKKVKSLTLNLKAQEACQQIVEYILVVGIGEYNFTEKVFENPYFKENPYNYFLPFFKENNPLFDNIYDNYDGENIEKFIEVLEKSPYPDSFKYIVCNTTYKKNETEDDPDNMYNLERHYNINGAYYPYAGYIQEFVSFIINFPALQHKKLIDTQLKITSTPLKDYLLSDKEKYRVLGIHFQKDKNWGQAIINFEKYLQLQSDDIMILDNLVTCYLNNKEDEKAKDMSIRIFEEFPENEYNLIRLVDIYSSKGDDDLALEIIDKYESENPLIHFKKAGVLIDLKKYDDALVSVQKADELSFKNKAILYDLYGLIYSHLGRYEESLKSFEEAISLDNKRPEFYGHIADLHGDIEDYETAIEYIEKALIIENSDKYYFRKIYFLLNSNKIEESYSTLSKIKNKNEEYFNALANYYRLKGDYESAISTIEKVINTSDDKRIVGTKAAIYASMGDDDNFYKLLEEILKDGVEAKMFLPDVKSRYKNEAKFISILENYNQEL